VGPPKAPPKSLPGDRNKEHSVIVGEGDHTYTVVMDAAVDGVMTRDPIGYQAFRQGWQPNRFVRMENIGHTDVVNPWITVNGKRNWRTLQEIADHAIEGCKTDADKARAIWEFTRHHRFHATTWDREVVDAVKVFNVYGYTLCGNDAQVISDLWKAAGLKVRRGFPVGHCVAEAFYDGEYHLLDGDEHCVFLRRDNKTIASEAEVVRDHDLVKRTHTYGILRSDSRRTDEFSASLYVHEGERKGQHGGRSKHTMAYVLRPDESIEWRWDHVGKQYTKGTDLKGEKWRKNGQGDLRAWGKNAYADLRNGRMRYRPDLANPAARKGVADSANLAASPGSLRPEAADKPCHVTWRIASPYVIVGGRANVKVQRPGADDSLEISLSPDGKKWQPLWTADKIGASERELVFGERLSPAKQPEYQYFVRVDMRGGARIDAIEFHTDVQMAPLSLPELEAGKNTVRYVDETDGPRRVRITHSWVERPTWHPPAAPKLLSPADEATVEGTKVKLAWKPAADPDGDEIRDYQVQLSEHADMRWVLSPNFDKLLSRTGYRGKTEWAPPYVGLLNPNTAYYWRVRARDANEVWGPWSEMRSFQCDAPGVPINVRATPDPANGTVLLTWDANPVGAAPVKFKVYASDEQGFTPSDTSYHVRMGRGFCRDLEEYEAKGNVNEQVKTAANLAATTRERQLMVVGPDVKLPNANRAFYRVVTVDARGLASGHSDYAETPRPFICTTPATQAAAGKRWTYEPKSLLSIGDLRCKRGYKRAFWHREELTWSLVKAPKWLTIDSATGRITGEPGPDAAGKHSVVVRVTNNKQKTAEQAFELEVR